MHVILQVVVQQAIWKETFVTLINNDHKNFYEVVSFRHMTTFKFVSQMV